jgi:hypothetical protein
LFEIVRAQTLRKFSLSEAEAILQLVYRLTDEASREVKYLVSCVEALPDKASPRSQELQARTNEIITRWQNKIERLGAKPKGLWLVDFDNGTGFFCWKFPETKISFFHGYQDGFTGRKMIPEKEASRNADRDQSN